MHTPSPFVGPSGLLLNKLLAEVGIERDACFVGNVCLEERTPVLMADLTWKPIADVQIGEHIMAFDEHGKTRGDLLRKWRMATVTNKVVSQKACWLMQSEHGDLTLTPDHRVMSMPDNKCSSARWSKISDLWVGRSNFALAFQCQYQALSDPYQLGYLAGLFDGEGTLTAQSAPLAKRNLRAAFYNTNKEIVVRAAQFLMRLGFQLDVDYYSPRDQSHKPGYRVCIKGGVGQVVRFLALVRPARLLNRFYELISDPPVFRPKPSRIYARNKNVGVKTVVDLTTTTGTFIANGFAVHNCQVQPPRNEIKHFVWDGVEIQSGLDALSRDLAAFQPHFCLLLGSTALRALKGDLKANVSDWRGSLFLASAIAKGVKSMAAYHPAALLRDYSLTAVTRFDLKRAKQELGVDGLELPKREVVIAHPDNGWTPERIRDWCLTQRQLGTPLAVDIEGVVDYVECVGFATSPAFALVVPFISVSGESVWSEEDEYAIWTELEQLLQAPEVPKVLQNSLYDCFILAWSYGIVVRPVADDTMLKHHELYCELEKSLAFQTSLYTRQAHYKYQRKLSKNMQTTTD